MASRHALILAVVVPLAIGCSPAPGRAAPAADDMTPRQIVARTADTVTMLPASTDGATVGVDYTYTMPHCGTLGPVDVDGSFWDAVAGGTIIDGLAGVFRLTSPSEAVFLADGGTWVGLARHAGAKSFAICD